MRQQRIRIRTEEQAVEPFLTVKRAPARNNTQVRSAASLANSGVENQALQSQTMSQRQTFPFIRESTDPTASLVPQMNSRLSRPDDRLEREADAAASLVTESKGSKPAELSLSAAGSDGAVHRACAECESEKDETEDEGKVPGGSFSGAEVAGAASGDLEQTAPTPETQPAISPDAPKLDSQTPAQEPGQDAKTPAPSDDKTVTPDATTQAQAPSSFVVDDSTASPAPGQMKKSDFLSSLEISIRATADEILKSTGRSTDDCPYIQYWFNYYQAQDAEKIDKAIGKYAPETSEAGSAGELISLITARARRAVENWAATGQATGVPSEAASAPISAADGAEDNKSSTPAAMQSKEKDGGARQTDHPESIRSSLGQGRPIESSVGAQMGTAFGSDFSNVRVHTDSHAAQVADSLNARAFTIGNDIAFGSGEYQPGTAVGDALLAHELAHVVQQDGGSEGRDIPKGANSSDRSFEEDADRSAAGAVASLWGRSKTGLSDLARNVTPSLRSGLRLSRCGNNCKPTFKSFTATSSNTFVIGNLGSNPECDVSLSGPGMKFKSEVDVPANCKGKLKYLQHIDRCDMKRDLAGTTWQLSTNGFARDGSDPYNGTEKRVTSAGTVTFEESDSPEFGNTTGNDFLSGSDRFKTWLLWTPDSIFADRVPLGVVEWHWSGNAVKEHNDGICQTDWVVHDPIAPSQTGAATSVPPPTVAAVYPGGFRYVVGTCSGATSPPAKPSSPASPQPPNKESPKK